MLQVLREHGALTRAEVADRIGLSRTTLSEITSSLLERRVISTLGPEGEANGRGRPAERLQLDPTAGQYIGVDFRPNLASVVVANAARELIASDAVSLEPAADWETRIDAVFALITRMSTEVGIHVDSVLGVAVGLPGPFARRSSRDDYRPTEESRTAAAELVRTSP